MSSDDIIIYVSMDMYGLGGLGVPNNVADFVPVEATAGIAGIADLPYTELTFILFLQDNTVSWYSLRQHQHRHHSLSATILLFGPSTITANN